MLDILIKGGTIVDGSGSAARPGTVGIRHGKIVMDPADTNAKETVDATGKIVCPGFIDAHSHGDAMIGTESGRHFKTVQGITTELCGNCGSGYAPVTGPYKEEILKNFDWNYPVEEVSQWDRFRDFLDYVENRAKMSANARFYVGHSMLRRCALGYQNANRPATFEELEQMKSLLREAMEAGAAGLSTGLIYPPSCYAKTEEVVELAKVIAPFGGIYASHIRNEADRVVEAVQEVLDVGRLAGVETCISHHKVQGRENWGKQKITLEMIRKANEEGFHTTCDLYPFLRSMNVLRSLMPPWYMADGATALMKRLEDKAFRKQVRAEMESPDTPFDNFYRHSGGWGGVLIAYAKNTHDAPGKTIAEYAAEQGKDPFEAYFDLLIANEGVAGGVYDTMCDENMIEIAQSPFCVIGTDGCSPSWKGFGHPRASAAFPWAIEYFVKDKKVFSLEEMIRKMTSLTADRLRVPNKGLLRDGYDADVLVLDYEGLKVHAGYADPHRKTEGIDRVIVGGKTVYQDMEFTGVFSGSLVRFQGK